MKNNKAEKVSKKKRTRRRKKTQQKNKTLPRRNSQRKNFSALLSFLATHNVAMAKKFFSCENKENKRKRVISKQKTMRTEKETQFGIALPLLW